MEKLFVHKKIPQTKKGFTLIDSLVALVLFGTVLGLYFKQQEEINMSKLAKTYANQTLSYANFYADYLNTTYGQQTTSKGDAFLNISWYQKYLKQLHDNPDAKIYLSPNEVIQYQKKDIDRGVKNPYNVWDNSLNKKSMFDEVPCLMLGYNKNTKSMYGIMYYASDAKKYKNKINIALKAGTFLQSKGIIYTYDKSNNEKYWQSFGWLPDPSSFGGSAKCGGGLSKNSPIIDMDLLLNFNKRILQINTLKKTTDQQYNSNNYTVNNNSRFLPGHLLNENTLKTNLVLNSGESVTLNSSKGVGVNLAYGQNSEATLNMGTNTTGDNTVLLTDTIQPNSTYQSGSPCTSNEIGKTVADAGNPNNNPNDKIAQMLAKNLLTCSYNKLLCLNGGNTCYLPASQNKFSFSNPNGLTDSSGNFICPAYAPFANGANVAALNNNVLVVHNQGGASTSGASIAVWLDDGHANFPWVSINNSGPFTYTVKYGDWSFLKQIDFSQIQGSPSFALNNSSSGYITKSITTSGTNYLVNVGFSVLQNSNDCSNTCSSLNSLLGTTNANPATWQEVNTAIASVGRGWWNGKSDTTGVTGIPSGKCGCVKLNGTSVSGLALVNSSSNILTSINCTNNPEYISQ